MSKMRSLTDGECSFNAIRLDDRQASIAGSFGDWAWTVLESRVAVRSRAAISFMLRDPRDIYLINAASIDLVQSYPYAGVFRKTLLYRGGVVSNFFITAPLRSQSCRTSLARFSLLSEVGAGAAT